jgi:hypothetical protein
MRRGCLRKPGCNRCYSHADASADSNTGAYPNSYAHSNSFSLSHQSRDLHDAGESDIR